MVYTEVLNCSETKKKGGVSVYADQFAVHSQQNTAGHLP
jgi:hypothetical protein